MSKTKKILSAVIALMLVLNVFAISAFAADVDTGYTQEWGLTVTELTATTFRVDVSLKTNYPTGAIQFKLLNSDSTVANFTSTSYEVGAAMPASYAAEISANPSTGLAVVVPQLTGTAPVEAVAIDGVIASITYTYSGTGMATITLENNPKTTGEDANVGGTLIAVRMASGVLNNGSQVVGQVVTIPEGKGSVDIGTVAADPDLAVKAGVTGVVIDTTRKFGSAIDGVVYGLPLLDNGATRIAAGSYYDSFIEATNGGTLAYVKTPYVTRPASYGTGAQIQVKNSSGTVVKTYVIVLFGDVDGSGKIDSNDVTKTYIEAQTNGTLELAQIMAANVVTLARGTAAQKASYLYATASPDITAIYGDVLAPGTKFVPATIAAAHLGFMATNYQ